MFVDIQDYSANYIEKGIRLDMIVFREYSRKNHSIKDICIYIFIAISSQYCMV